jgi:hypothetical protein
MLKIEMLPLKLAIRTVMNDVWYSNALPEWYTPECVDEAARVKHLSDRIKRYLEGEIPLNALSLQVPRLTGGTRTWVVPAVNDQMIMHACVASLSTIVAMSFDRKHVFSCEPNDNPSRIAFMKPQIAAMFAFNKETVRRLQQGAFVLELDIENAFSSIDRDQFIGFLEKIRPDSMEVTLISWLINAWAGKESGIPLINDSVFFLGSAYLNVVDRVVSAVTDDFIRYMDDYRIFGNNKAELEALFEKISHGLLQLGLKVNPRKVRIGSSKDFLEPVTEMRFATNQQIKANSQYVINLDAGIDTQIEPEQLATLVARSLETPTDYLNEGFGRCLLGAMRRYRLNTAIYRRAGHEDQGLGVRLRTLLVEDPKALELTRTRLIEYGNKPEHTWRAIWVIYLIEQQGSAQRFDSQLAHIEQNTQMPAVAKLWARRCRRGIGGEPEKLGNELLHDMSYIEAGLHCC